MFYIILIIIFVICCIKKEKFTNIKKIIKLEDNILNQCFSKQELHSFNKYSSVAKIIKKFNGILYLTPTEYIDELPYIPFTSTGYFVNNLCIDKKFRNQRNASKLIEYSINQTKSAKRNYLITQVLEDNYLALKLFKKFGFTELNKSLNQFNKNYYVLIKYLN